MDVSVGECMNISSFVRGTSYNVFRLETNRKYLFRVRAENQYGVSAPLWRRIATGSSSTTASFKTQHITWPTASSSDTNRVPRSSQKRGRNEQTVAVLVAVQDQGQIHRPRSPRGPAAHQSHRTYADLHHLHLTVAAGSRVG